MSCGRPHATPCSEVLAKLYLYLDREIDLEVYEQIRVHLDECGPCLAEHEVDRLIKAIVQRCCASDHAPGDLRRKIVQQLRQVRRDVDADPRAGGATTGA